MKKSDKHICGIHFTIILPTHPQLIKKHPNAPQTCDLVLIVRVSNPSTGLISVLQSSNLIRQLKLVIVQIYLYLLSFCDLTSLFSSS